MSNEPKLKIEFNDKQNSILYNDTNEKFLLTADNINEIKEVVNNLSDNIIGFVNESDILKYLTFIIPISFDETCEYSFKFQVATNLNFTNPIEYSLSGNSNNFKIFQQGIWANISNNKIVSSDFGNALQLNIDDRFPLLSNNILVGRYQWINITNNESTQWFGCGIQNTINYDTDNLFEKDQLIDLYLSGKNTLSSSESETYQLIGVNENGEEINLTSNATFKFDNEELNNNKITAPQIINNDSIYMLFANVTYNNKKYATSLAILFKSSSKTFNIQLSKHNLSLNESIIFTATLNNSNIVPNIEILNQSENFELNINNNQITAIKIIKNENVMIKFSYTDENNKNYEKIESITLNYEEKIFNIQLGTSSLSLNDLNLSATTFTATLDNNEINDYNNLSSNILNQTDRFQLTVNKTNKKIEANKVLNFEKIIIEFLYKKDDINYQKIVNVDLIPKAVLTGLIINCNNQVSEPNTLTYLISGTYSDNTSRELNSDEYTVSGSQSTINKSTKTVTLNFTSNKETLIFESNGIKETEVINLNLIELYDLSGNIPQSVQYNSNWSLSLSFKLKKQLENQVNGTWVNVNNVQVEEAGAIKYLNILNNVISFKNNVFDTIFDTDISTCLKATYTDVTTGKTISNHFILKILGKEDENVFSAYIDDLDHKLGKNETIEFECYFNGHAIEDKTKLSSSIINRSDSENGNLIINCNNLSITSPSIIEESENIGVEIKYLDPISNRKYSDAFMVNLVPDILMVDVSGCELIDNDTKLQITYTGTLNNESINDSNLSSELIGDPTNDITLNHNIITINDITTNKIFNVKFTYNNVENIKQISTKIFDKVGIINVDPSETLNIKTISLIKPESDEALYLKIEYSKNPDFPVNGTSIIDTKNYISSYMKVFDGYNFIKIPTGGLGTPFNNQPVAITIPELNVNTTTYIRYYWYYTDENDRQVNSDYGALVYPTINNNLN